MAPEILYKYTTAETALINLETSMLRWSCPLLFNDLSEFKRVPRFDPTLDQALNMLPKIFTEIAHGNYQVDESKLILTNRKLLELFRLCKENGINLQELYERAKYQNESSYDIAYSNLIKEFVDTELIHRSRVICLTDNPNNQAMWANYADSNKGVLLGFRHLPELDTPFQLAQKIQYSSEKTIVGSGIDFFLYGGTPEIHSATLNEICFTKRIEWSYEQEWRVMTFSIDDNEKKFNDYKFYEDELESITFGLKTLDTTKKAINNYVTTKYQKCKLFQIYEIDGEFVRKELKAI